MITEYKIDRISEIITQLLIYYLKNLWNNFAITKKKFKCL